MEVSRVLKISMTQGCAALVLISLLTVESIAAETRYPPETLVASRGGASVIMQDVDAALIGLPEAERANFMNSPKRIEELIDRLLINRQLANEARAAKLDQNPLFKLALEQQSDKILTDQLAMKLRADIPLGDVQLLAKERYDVNPDAYTTPARAAVQHILIDTKTHSDAEARTLAESIRQKAIAGGNFSELVTEFSDDGSKRSNDGRIPDGEAEGLVPEFVAAVRQLKTKGEISPVVKTSFGYHIIMLEERYPARPQTYDQVKDRIVTDLASRMRDSRVKEHVDQLKSMELEATPEVVASLRTRYLPLDASDKPADPSSK